LLVEINYCDVSLATLKILVNLRKRWAAE